MKKESNNIEHDTEKIRQKENILKLKNGTIAFIAYTDRAYWHSA